MGTEFWNGAEAAHRRVMMKAAGYSDSDINVHPAKGAVHLRLGNLRICVRLPRRSRRESGRQAVCR